ncbi:MAG: type II secretion system protein GspH [Gammaproteobacteria bacterium]|nr:type II secretion system protein GspH [Gammaproteobacteria bacterium]RPG26335.1 MAG: type II secretion system protein GspH [Gammaproteobacteria bacterium TMED50]
MQIFVSRICSAFQLRGKPDVLGFTLIEILVVLFIVSVMTGIVVANIPALTVTDSFDTEMNRLRTLMMLAHDEAVSGSEELGFRTHGDGYEFLRYVDVEQKWELLEERPFRPRQLHDGQSISLRIEDVTLTIGEDDPPAVLILSSGEVTPFHLILEDDLGSRVLTADGYGGFEWDDGREG